jgi:hypothetical protein
MQRFFGYFWAYLVDLHHYIIPWEGCIYPYNIPIDVVKIARMSARLHEFYTTIEWEPTEERIEVCRPTFFLSFLFPLFLSLSLSFSENRGGLGWP